VLCIVFLEGGSALDEGELLLLGGARERGSDLEAPPSGALFSQKVSIQLCITAESEYPRMLITRLPTQLDRVLPAHTMQIIIPVPKLQKPTPWLSQSSHLRVFLNRRQKASLLCFSLGVMLLFGIIA
jgi:hypothetical protein